MAETKFIPAWKDEDGNRLLFLAPNHVFDDWDDAFKYQASEFIFYIPLGLIPSGIVEMQLEDGKGEIPHVIADFHNAVFSGPAAIIEGPLFEQASK